MTDVSLSRPANLTAVCYILVRSTSQHQPRCVSIRLHSELIPGTGLLGKRSARSRSALLFLTCVELLTCSSPKPLGQASLTEGSRTKTPSVPCQGSAHSQLAGPARRRRTLTASYLPTDGSGH